VRAGALPRSLLLPYVPTKIKIRTQAVPVPVRAGALACRLSSHSLLLPYVLIKIRTQAVSVPVRAGALACLLSSQSILLLYISIRIRRQAVLVPVRAGALARCPTAYY